MEQSNDMTLTDLLARVGTVEIEKTLTDDAGNTLATAKHSMDATRLPPASAVFVFEYGAKQLLGDTATSGFARRTDDQKRPLTDAARWQYAAEYVVAKVDALYQGVFRSRSSRGSVSPVEKVLRTLLETAMVAAGMKPKPKELAAAARKMLAEQPDHAMVQQASLVIENARNAVAKSVEAPALEAPEADEAEAADEATAS